MWFRRTVALLLSLSLSISLQLEGADAAGRSSSTPVNTILHGKGVPKSSLGINGDFYIDTRSLLIYGPKAKGKWPTPQNIQGPTGATGSDGRNGSDAKVTSNSNLSSVAGPQGAQGEKGPQGEKGEPGLPGAMGPAGLPGAEGPAGASGSSGPAGAQGAQGPTGAQGAAGPAGAVGPSEVTVVDIPSITLSTSVEFSYSLSEPLRVFSANKNYKFEIYLRGTSSLIDLELGLDLISSGNTVKFDYQRSDFKLVTYSSVAYSYGFLISGTIQVSETESGLVLRIIDGGGETFKGALILKGKAYITLVGAIN